MTEQLQKVFLFGPGFAGHALVRIWAGKVYGSVRSAEKAAPLQAAGIEPVMLDDAERIGEAVEGAHLIISAPPDDNGCPALTYLGEVADVARTVTYLSTTGVYGDLEGGWAFEWTRPAPGSARAQRRVIAERAWQARRADLKIARLPGIYGPGRSVLDRLRAGKASRVIKPGQVFSRIHVDDLASGLAALIESPANGVFHFCDEMAAPPQDVTVFGAGLINADLPPAVPISEAGLSPMALSFYGECKRVSNARAKAALNWQPQYPTYRDGLTEIALLEARAADQDGSSLA